MRDASPAVEHTTARRSTSLISNAIGGASVEFDGRAPVADLVDRVERLVRGYG